MQFAYRRVYASRPSERLQQVFERLHGTIRLDT
jgi:hypothetical protein